MLEFFFDCSSPWTYLAFHNIQPLAKELGVEINWRPILVGGIFNTVNPSVYASARDAGAVEGALHEKGSRRLGALRGACDQDAADGISGEQRQGDARLHLAGQGHGAVRHRGVRDLLGRRQGHLAGFGADGGLQEGRRRSRQILRGHRPAGDQGPAQGQHGRGDGARRLWFADDLCRQDRHVFRQRPDAADPRGAASA